MKYEYVETFELQKLVHLHYLKVTFKNTTKFALFHAFRNHVTFTITEIEQPRALTFFKDNRNIEMKVKDKFPWEEIIKNANTLGKDEKEFFPEGRKIKSSIFANLAGLTIVRIMEYVN